MMKRWVSHHAIKLCLSSRPYSEFLRPLKIPGNLLIQLHELNYYAIKAYCLDRLENDVFAQKRRFLCQDLVSVMVQHAQGVFLWVHLAIGVLLVGFRQGDPDSVLKDKLSELPRDLDMLYRKLREPIEADRIQRVRSNRILLLAAMNPFGHYMNAIAFSWLEQERVNRESLLNPDFPQFDSLRQYSHQEIFRRVEYVKKQIAGLARGFLEVYESHFKPPFHTYKVRFCHRTARDYLLQN